MKIIGLTGPSGAGKGMVSSLFEYHNIESIDTDAVYREVITPPSKCLSELVHEFGKEILFPNGTLNRKMLASVVFSDKTKNKQKKLNSITHKYILKRCMSIMDTRKARGDSAIIIDAPLLFESGFDSLCDITIAVIAKKETRTERIIKRDGISREAALARIDAQMSDEYYTSRADHVIYNDGDTESLKKSVDELINELEVFNS